MLSQKIGGDETIDHVIDRILLSRKENTLKLTEGELKEMFQPKRGEKMKEKSKKKEKKSTKKILAIGTIEGINKVVCPECNVFATRGTIVAISRKW